MNNIISQDSWCVTLSKDNRQCVWEHNDEEISHHLMIEQVVLGLNCKERCMVEATFFVTSGEEKSTMICQLIPDAVPNCKLSLSFKQQVKLNLAAGEGPVYITGTHSQEIEDMEEESDDEGAPVPELVDGEASDGEEEESSDEEEEGVDEDKMLEELAAAQANKLKTFMKKDKKAIANTKPGPLSKKSDAAPEKKEEPAAEQKEAVAAKKEAVVAKKEVVVAKKEVITAKKEVVAETVVEELNTPAVAAEKSADVEMEEESEEESEEDDDDEEDEEGEEDDDDDDDDEDDKDDDKEAEEVESDDQEEEGDDDESEEESEEEEAAPVSKKRKTEAATPVAVKSNGDAKATPKAVKQSKKPQTPVAAPNLNELKKKLLASPNLPKKYEKFVNLMKNAHKVQSDKEIKNTWEYLQKSKK